MTDSEPALVLCPHCKEVTIIAELNCRIFRHGVFRATFQQMNPHEVKVECDRVFADGLIWGCGKPFYVKGDFSTGLTVEVCDYI